MEFQIKRILLVEEKAADAQQVLRLLEKCSQLKVSLKRIRQIEMGIAILKEFDLILLAYPLSDNRDLTSIKIFQQHAPHLPIVILSKIDNLDIAARSISLGAQDYLIKNELKPKIFVRSIQLAIERQRHTFETSQQALMKKMLDRICQSIDINTILQTTAKVIQEFLRCDRVVIYGCESESTEIVAVSDRTESTNAELEPSIEQFAQGIDFYKQSSFLSESTTVYAVENTYDGMSPLAIDSQLIRSYLLLPIYSQKSNLAIENDSSFFSIANANFHGREELWGMFVAYNIQETRQWWDWEINFLQSLTTQVMVAVRRSQLCGRLRAANKELQQLAILDGLTGIANRRYFDLVLNKEWQRLAREQLPLSLILADVDYFKAYNDTYGHQAGDRCLQTIARILQNCIRRPADLVARYGGEEFALILPNTDAQGALFIAHRIVRKLAQQNIPHLQSKVSQSVTFSLGVTTKVPHPKQSGSTIIEVADSLLYRAKKAGRNQLAVDNGLVRSHQLDTNN